MNRIRIGIENLFQTLQLAKNNRFMKWTLVLEGTVFIAVLGLLSYQLLHLPEIKTVNSAGIKIDANNRQELTNIPSNLFYSEKAAPIIKAGPVFSKLVLTGIGKVNGVYKGTVEDEDGNYYYVREGETVKGMTVKKISGQQMVLADKAGNKQVLNLER